MMPDAECVKIVSDILNALELNDFTIKVRQFLQAIRPEVDGHIPR